MNDLAVYLTAQKYLALMNAAEADPDSSVYEVLFWQRRYWLAMRREVQLLPRDRRVAA